MMTDKGKFCFYCGKLNDDQHQGQHEQVPGPLPAPRFYTACGCPLLHHRPNCPQKKNTTASPTPMIVTGSVAFALERDALKADNDRLRRELEEAKTERDEIRTDLAAAGALLSPADPHISLPEAISELKVELARMRPVVEAASEFDEWCGDERCASPTCKVARAMDAYRAGAGKEGE